MSTKIYNGYRFKKSMSLKDLHKFCNDFRVKITPIAHDLYHRTFIDKMLQLYDFNQFGLYDSDMYFVNKRKDNDLFMGVDEYFREKRKKVDRTQERDPEVDFSLSFCILPLTKKKRVNLTLYTEKKELREVFEAMPEIEDYHYQNQTDMPDDVTTRQWNTRKKDWDDALGGNMDLTPAEAGFTYEPYSHKYFSFYNFNRDLFTQYLPDRNERIRRIAVEIMFNDFHDRQPPLEKLSENATKAEKEARYDLNMKIYWEYVDYKNSDEGKDELKTIMDKIGPEFRDFKDWSEFAQLKMDWCPKNQEILNKAKKPYWLD